MTGLLTNDQSLTNSAADFGAYNCLRISAVTGMTGKPKLFRPSHTLYTTIYNTYNVLYCIGHSGHIGQRVHFQQVAKSKSDRSDRSDRNFFVKIENRPK